MNFFFRWMLNFDVRRMKIGCFCSSGEFFKLTNFFYFSWLIQGMRKWKMKNFFGLKFFSRAKIEKRILGLHKGMLNKKVENYFCVEISANVKFERKLFSVYKEVYLQIWRLHKKSPQKKVWRLCIASGWVYKEIFPQISRINPTKI